MPTVAPVRNVIRMATGRYAVGGISEAVGCGEGVAVKASVGELSVAIWVASSEF